MNLVELVGDIKNVNDDLIVFLENREDFKSNVIISEGMDGDNGIKVDNGKKYYYLIEIFLAKEFIEDWLQSIEFSPSPDEIAKRLYDYAINDA